LYDKCVIAAEPPDLGITRSAMPLTLEQIDALKLHFDRRTAQFAEAGYDRFGAPEFIIDQARGLTGPVLDLGTGTGITARALAGRGFDVVGADSCADDLQVAEALTRDSGLAARVRYLLADASQLPVPDGHFGSAAAVDFLHHLDEGVPVLTELLRVVKPGGLIVLADFSAAGFEMVARIHAAEGRVHPEGPVTVEWARGFLVAAGVTAVTLAAGQFHRVAVLRTPDRRPAAATSTSTC
jgi:ubiquinone/menaquinone biosynthesis C-methylase UbiE